MHSRQPGICFLLLFAFGLTSCGRFSNSKLSSFDSLITTQERLLLRSHMSIDKKVTMDGRQDQASLTPDSSGWENELGIFRQLTSYQKPSYIRLYRITDGVNDPRSNLTIKRYETSENIPVKSLSFYYHNQMSNLKKIEGVYEEKNLLYYTARTLILEFDDAKGSPIISSYSVTGVQKMAIGDSIRFSIKTHVID